MEKNKSIAVCFSVTVICVTIAYLGSYLGYLYHKGYHTGVHVAMANYNVKDKELEIGLHDMRTYCIAKVMDKSRQNGHPCKVEEAERACGKVKSNEED